MIKKGLPDNKAKKELWNKIKRKLCIQKNDQRMEIASKKNEEAIQQEKRIYMSMKSRLGDIV
ncbi:hypothetical protein DRN50_07560 [Thermococci archaeon]|nr:MAG: hypothetical protein DRN50_07560 [Thermococci archaeon]